MNESTATHKANEKDLGDAIGSALKANLPEAEWQWLSEQVARIAADPQQRVVAQVFTSLPRQLKGARKDGWISLTEPYTGPNGLPLIVERWPTVKLARVWVLMAIPKQEQTTYVQLIERLFTYGEMEELAALYAALPVYHYPEAWASRCKEGIRSNIGPVRQAVTLQNAYPGRFLDEGGWNQLVLKAFFTEEPIGAIVGLRERNNTRLAGALVDYAYERHAAGRRIDPMLWLLIAPFLDERAYHLMTQMLKESGTLSERQAISYAFKNSGFGPAKQYVENDAALRKLSDAMETQWEYGRKDEQGTTSYNNR
ncbi:EboA domain-containing protein [Parapedobacter deserti]|uniref:EboA domain-containing protein n=1 Tax=Parapedobacter deserti TaxID=1912957 RepID=A0ABV7JNU8_9SPHI